MKNLNASLLCISILQFLVGCSSIPPQVVTSAETLKQYSAKLEDANLKIIDEYQGRLERVSTTLTRSNERYLTEYEQDVNALNQEIQEAEKSSDMLSQALNIVMAADKNITRSALFTVDQETQLKAMLSQLQGASAARKKNRDAIVNPAGFASAHQLLHEEQDKLHSQHLEAQQKLKERLTQENTQLNSGFDDLIAYLRSLVKVNEERSRVLGKTQSTAQSLADKAEKSETLNTIGTIFKAINDSEKK